MAIHLEDQIIFGVYWQGQYFIDMSLLCSLRSVPFIFISIADLLERILKQNYSTPFLEHYLDDFITLANPSSIAYKVLFPIVIAANSGRQNSLSFFCDNHSIVDVLRPGTSRDPWK